MIDPAIHMKAVLFLLIACFQLQNIKAAENRAVGVKYVLLESLEKEKKLSISKVELNALKVYGVDKKIELYNLNFKNALILFSILPNLEGKSESWKEISLTRIVQDTIGLDGLLDFHRSGLKTYFSSGYTDVKALKRDNIFLIVKRNEKYFLPERCVIEYFEILDTEPLFPYNLGNIYLTTRSTKLSVKEFEERYQRSNMYGEYSPNAIVSAEGNGTYLRQPQERPSLFLSKTVLINRQTGFQFWQFTNWGLHGLDKYRGIDRLIYLPKVGIVAGSFDYYFWTGRNTQSMMQKYLNEELMMPVTINGSPVEIQSVIR